MKKQYKDALTLTRQTPSPSLHDEYVIKEKCKHVFNKKGQDCKGKWSKFTISHRLLVKSSSIFARTHNY